MTNDGRVDQQDRDFLIIHVLATTVGDSNLDGVFNSADLVTVFRAAEYEDAISFNSGWKDGDWNGDGDFGTADLVVAFQAATYSANSESFLRRAESLSSEVSAALLGSRTAVEVQKVSVTHVVGENEHREYKLGRQQSMVHDRLFDSESIESLF